MGKTNRDILGEAVGIDGPFQGQYANGQVGGRGILLEKNPADQTLIRTDLCRQMPGMGLMLRTRFTRDIFLHRIGMMMIRRNQQHRQENRQHQECGYALFPWHHQESTCQVTNNSLNTMYPQEAEPWQKRISDKTGNRSRLWAREGGVLTGSMHRDSRP